jgi:protein gp37
VGRERGKTASTDCRALICSATHLRKSGFFPSNHCWKHLGPVNLKGINWVIVGGESGPGARPMTREWVRDLRHQCQKDRVPFFFKQWGWRAEKRGGTPAGWSNA